MGVTWSVSYSWMSIDSPTAGQAATTSIRTGWVLLSVEVLPEITRFLFPGPIPRRWARSTCSSLPPERFTEDTVIDLAPISSPSPSI